MVNVIILIAKQYIYSVKCISKQLHFPQLIAKISTYKKMEEIAAKKHKNMEKHNKKWFLYDRL